MSFSEIYNSEELSLLSSCSICPRHCKVNRLLCEKGVCGLDANINIAAICVHKGEEPELCGEQGVCNIFFGGCNLHCCYCQNWEISRANKCSLLNSYTYQTALDTIEQILSTGVKSVGFVSPSHVIPQVKAIIRGLHERGLYPTTIYNTNGYDTKETIRSLENLIDVYLTDYKYCSPSLSKQLSQAADYPSVALESIREMYRQKGATLLYDDSNTIVGGLIIRLLVLPHHANECKKILRTISDEISLGVHISLMSQYYPTPEVNIAELKDKLSIQEYAEVVSEMEHLGFRHGWTQMIESAETYRPAFYSNKPFNES